MNFGKSSFTVMGNKGKRLEASVNAMLPRPFCKRTSQGWYTPLIKLLVSIYHQSLRIKDLPDSIPPKDCPNERLPMISNVAKLNHKTRSIPCSPDPQTPSFLMRLSTTSLINPSWLFNALSENAAETYFFRLAWRIGSRSEIMECASGLKMPPSKNLDLIKVWCCPCRDP